MDISKLQLESSDENEVGKVLDSLLEMLTSGSPTEDGPALCRKLIASLHSHPTLAARIAEVFATLAKQASFRDVAVSEGLLPHLLPLLGSPSPSTQLQALRAVGNLCYEHDPCRELVLEGGGCPLLVDSLRTCTTLPAREEHSRAKCVTCGCLLNVTNQNEKLCRAVVELGAPNLLSTLLAQEGEGEAAIQMALQALAGLLESESVNLDALTSSPLPSALSLLLQRCNEGQLDLTESVMEIIETLVNNERWKVTLVDAGCADHLTAVTDEEVQQRALDIIVLLLAEDACLQKLFESGKVLSSALGWMGDRRSSPERKASAALIVANMARNDTTCAALVQQGVVPVLIELVKAEEPPEIHGKIHHAALSALRNLSLPAANKHLFLTEGVVDAALYALRHSSMAHVQFKALGTLRLLTDKQAEVCSHVVSEEGVITRVCEVCASAGPVHVQIEGSRLLASIVKHCKDADVMHRVVGEGGTRWIVSLMELEHELLRNEGLVALNLLAALHQDVILSSMEESDVASQLLKVLSTSSSSPEILSNALVLLASLLSSKSDTLRTKLSSQEMVAALQSLCSHDDEGVKVKAQEVSKQLHSYV